MEVHSIKNNTEQQTKDSKTMAFVVCNSAPPVAFPTGGLTHPSAFDRLLFFVAPLFHLLYFLLI